MTTTCAHCGSSDTESECDRIFCFNCAGHTDFHGNALPRDPQFTAPNWGAHTLNGGE